MSEIKIEQLSTSELLGEVKYLLENTKPHNLIDRRLTEKGRFALELMVDEVSRRWQGRDHVDCPHCGSSESTDDPVDIDNSDTEFFICSQCNTRFGAAMQKSFAGYTTEENFSEE